MLGRMWNFVHSSKEAKERICEVTRARVRYVEFHGSSLFLPPNISPKRGETCVGQTLRVVKTNYMIENVHSNSLSETQRNLWIAKFRYT